jgi:hypothetical protein
MRLCRALPSHEAAELAASESEGGSLWVLEAVRLWKGATQAHSEDH